MINVISNNLLSLDIEFGNAAGFFSGHKNNVCSNEKYAESFDRVFIPTLEKTGLEIRENYFISSDEINRNICYLVKGESKIFDLVSRYVVLSDSRPAFIDKKIITHACSNIYHQFPVGKVKVPIGNNGWLYFSDNNSTEHPFFNSVFYVRDEAVEENGMKRWVVHHRKIVKQEVANLIVRSCNPRLEGELPFQWIIPRFLKKELFRIREAKFPNFPIMAVGEVLLNSGFHAKINTTIKLSHD